MPSTSDASMASEARIVLFEPRADRGRGRYVDHHRHHRVHRARHLRHAGCVSRVFVNLRRGDGVRETPSARLRGRETPSTLRPRRAAPTQTSATWYTRRRATTSRNRSRPRSLRRRRFLEGPTTRRHRPRAARPLPPHTSLAASPRVTSPCMMRGSSIPRSHDDDHDRK